MEQEPKQESRQESGEDAVKDFLNQSAFLAQFDDDEIDYLIECL